MRLVRDDADFVDQGPFITVVLSIIAVVIGLEICQLGGQLLRCF